MKTSLDIGTGNGVSLPAGEGNGHEARKAAKGEPGLTGQDVDHLDAERIDLVGASYGSRVALEYQRQFPRAVRRSVIDGVAPPDMALPASYSLDNQAALDSVIAACVAEPACARDHAGLQAKFRKLLQSLPRTVSASR